ncbi:TPA: methyltransferase domain-containing protein [Clostridioides difficile]|uniref:methyltransferase domain-containing protein n=1 Tax=Romboutsia sp. TaxID=1965302 RepID=UPI001C29019B|nr:methyltransferase domain-containing protein [Clostridioides difficile]HBH3615635.1 methyltransferase domain-containing protein [Clostridioides difficile]
MKKLKKIEVLRELLNENIEILRCPVCKNSIKAITENSVLCENNHCFNISKKGYVNLIQNNTKTIYDKSLFESRRKIYEDKTYDKLSKEIIAIIDKYTANKDSNYILDAGCGEGYYLNQLYLNNKINKKCRLFGIDISREGISLATSYENNILWSVSDLANLPFKNSKFDIILDILSPSNYKEFKRVLNKEGIVIKVVPDEHYLQEIRSKIKGNIKKETYSNKDIIDVFKDNLEIVYDNRITYRINPSNLEEFIKMTPLTSSLSQDQMNELIKSNIENITIDLNVIVGKIK